MKTKDLSAVYHYQNWEYRITEDDITDGESFIPAGEYNPHNVHPFILHDAGYVIAVVFAEHLQDALDIACDAGKLDRYQVSADDLKDYETGERTDVGSAHCPEGYPEYQGICYLGNASEPFDIEGLDAVEVPNSKWTREYWTLEQLQSQLERSLDLLGLDGRGPMGDSGRTDKAIEDEISKVKASLLEIARRRISE